MCFWFQDKKTKTVNALIKVCNRNPDKIIAWVRRNIWYEKDGITDYWKSPKQTLKDRKGDCEDFALLYYFAFKKIGLPCFLIGVYTKFKGHAVCAYEYKGKTYHISNWSKALCYSSHIKDIAKAVYKEWNRVLVFDINSYKPGKMPNIIERKTNKEEQ